MTHANLGLELLRQFDKGGRRAGMQAGGAGQRDIDPQLEIVFSLRHHRHRLAAWLGQPLDDVLNPNGARQPLHRFRVVQHIGQIGQQFDVLIGTGGDGHHQIHGLALIPAHASGKLGHRNTGVHDQVAILRQTVRDGDAVAEIGVGHLLAQQHAVDIAGLHVAAIHQQTAGNADGFGLVARLGGEADGGWGQFDHVGYSSRSEFRA